ncbi:unnamed protein product [Caenorhabditis auriculariae]|uniref:Uncharacterized protein n=1 Tax=Caenorhabditis auriculariae TaxID=2777116 RepID=A0A8S1HQP8_9PELO|nr:unnamed protein product [Caenorhabditis auriculariae]
MLDDVAEELDYFMAVGERRAPIKRRFCPRLKTSFEEHRWMENGLEPFLSQSFQSTSRFSNVICASSTASARILHIAYAFVSDGAIRRMQMPTCGHHQLAHFKWTHLIIWYSMDASAFGGASAAISTVDTAI